MSASTTSLPPHARYQRKPFVGSSHWWAQSVCSGLPSTTRVLDVGSGSGVMGEALRQQGIPGIAAVEIDAGTREQTAGIYEEISGTLESYKGRQFDLILLLDVLEHMTAPEDFLKELLPMVTPGGRILISVPNVAHWSTRLLLLFGSFTYTERGILDKTHFRFFTRSTLRSLLKAFPELDIKSEAVSIPPVEFVLPEPLWNNPIFKWLTGFHNRVAQLLPGLFGYQLLTVVQKRG